VVYSWDSKPSADGRPRYNNSYIITDHELNTLSKRVQEVKAISDRVCRERIEELRKIVSEV
jgi:hypothetical protein